MSTTSWSGRNRSIGNGDACGSGPPSMPTLVALITTSTESMSTISAIEMALAPSANFAVDVVDSGRRPATTIDACERRPSASTIERAAPPVPMTRTDLWSSADSPFGPVCSAIAWSSPSPSVESPHSSPSCQNTQFTELSASAAGVIWSTALATSAL